MGSVMNFLQMGRISWERVAENIITCLSWGVAMKIFWTSRRISKLSSILSHSSSTKWRTVDKLRNFWLLSASMRPGVPTTMCGGSSFSTFLFCSIGRPPKKLATLTPSRYRLKRSNSWQIWNASSRVWHSTMADTLPSSGSSCCSTVSTKTAVLPIPDLAWQMTSMPRMACGMHSCWTSLGCSKPQSWMARSSSGLSRKSLKPVAWMPT
mmetsp:Transcript_13392/g.34358  ORF Transcript_13392/g.34358 Transcript_13392/m.34358 type:complete len:209 (-) Transcript_13392:230-856(-)